MRLICGEQALSGVEGPDFICIGLPKAGTGWLFDQLGGHPDFWMPPVKELLYLQQPVSKIRFVDRSGRARPNPNGRERRVHREKFDERDLAFLKYAASCHGEQLSLERYAKLFSFKGELLSGDISPPYWTLGPEMIARLAARFPGTKIVLLVRDPVARAWSRISMAYRSNLFAPVLLEDPAGFRRYVEKTKKIGNIHTTAIVERWRMLAPDNPFRWFLFDDIAAQPENALRDILTFLGADPDKIVAGVAPDYNRKSEERKLDMSAMAKSVLAEHYADEIVAGAKLFGGAAAGWPAKYGL
jgi:hypothetical protein